MTWHTLLAVNCRHDRGKLRYKTYICTYLLAWKLPFDGRQSMLGTYVNATRAVTAFLSCGALLLRFNWPIATGAAIVVAGLICITVVHQTAFGAIIRRGVDLIAEIVQQRDLGCHALDVLVGTRCGRSACHRDFDIAIVRRGRRLQVLIMLRHGLLQGRMRMYMCGPIAEIRCALTHAGYARRHLSVRHADGGRHTQHSAHFGALAVAAVELLRVRGQIVGGQLQRMLILALCNKKRKWGKASMRQAVSVGDGNGSVSACQRIVLSTGHIVCSLYANIEPKLLSVQTFAQHTMQLQLQLQLPAAAVVAAVATRLTRANNGIHSKVNNVDRQLTQLSIRKLCGLQSNDQLTQWRAKFRLQRQHKVVASCCCPRLQALHGWHA